MPPNKNSNLFDGNQGSLPGMTNDQAPTYTLHNPAERRMWGAALTLIIIVMALNLIARFVSRFSKITT